MTGIEQWATSHGFTFITLNVFDGNAGAQALYDNLGYERETNHPRKAL